MRALAPEGETLSPELLFQQVPKRLFRCRFPRPDRKLPWRPAKAWSGFGRVGPGCEAPPRRLQPASPRKTREAPTVTSAWNKPGSEYQTSRALKPGVTAGGGSLAASRGKAGWPHRPREPENQIRR